MKCRTEVLRNEQYFSMIFFMTFFQILNETSITSFVNRCPFGHWRFMLKLSVFRLISYGEVSVNLFFQLADSSCQVQTESGISIKQYVDF